MEQLALDFDVALPTPSKAKSYLPPLLKSEMIALVLAVQQAMMMMNAGFVSREPKDLQRFAGDLHQALWDFEYLMDHRSLPKGCREWYAAYSAPVYEAAAKMLDHAAERRAAEPPEVEFKPGTFDKWRWTPRQHARAEARRQLYPGAKSGVDQEQALAHHWRLVEEDAVDPEACRRRVAWHEQRVIDAGRVPEPPIVIDVVDEPEMDERRVDKDHADAVRHAARKAL